jgi:hypothetical protein
MPRLPGVCAARAIALAWLFASSSVSATGATIDAATPEQQTAASDKYRAGMQLFQEEKFADALEAFKVSYDSVASPNSHLMIVRTLAKMGKPAAAYAEIDSVIKEAEKATEKSDKYKKTLDAARSERDDLKTKVGFVVVNVQASVSVAGRELDAAELGRRVAVDPGSVDVLLKLPSGEEEKRQVAVQPGRESKVEIAPPAVTRATPVAAAPASCPPPPPPAAGPNGIDQRTLALVVGGIGVAGFATFAIFGILDNGKYNDVKDACPTGVCSRALSDDAETGRTYQTIANVGLGVGIAGVVSSVVLFATAPSHTREQVASTTTPTVALGLGSVSVKGRF